MTEDLRNVADFLTEMPVCFLATIDGDEPRVRPFQYEFEQDGKLWFCTAKSKNVFKQMQTNPQVEICALKEDMTTLRLTGKVLLEDRKEIKERILKDQEALREIYGSVDNPDFTSFCLEHGQYTIFDLAGNVLKEGTF